LRADQFARYRQVHLFAGIGGWPIALRLAAWPADRSVWTASCPCQPFSSAGRGEGEEDQRHLWPALFSLVRVSRPDCVFGEQVGSLAGYRWLDGVRTDLEKEGYAVGAADLPAACVGAPHIRQRLFRVACLASDATGDGQPQLQRWPRPRNESDIANGVNAGDSSNADSRKRQRAGHHQSNSRPDGRLNTGRGREASLPPDARSQSPRQHDAGGGSKKGNAAQGRFAKENGQPGRHSGSGHWDAYDIIHYRDGKARRVEPGTFPLVDGLPGRVGLLRGYGNAIVPQVGAAFVRAFLEAETALGS
jgi:DNA (cytosine-5)-methyltransferase 1